MNLYMEPAPVGARAPAVGKVTAPSYNTPGLKSFATAGTGTIRAMRLFGDYIYALSGGSLYRIDSTGTATLCTGSTISPYGNAMMTDNGIQLTVLSNGLSYVVVGTTVSQITAAAYPAAGVSSIDTIDGYTVFTTADGGATVYGTAVVITGITQANPAVVTAAAHNFANGDQVYIQTVAGMTQVNGRYFTASAVTTNTFELAGIDSTSYTGYSAGGTASQILSHASGQWLISALYDSATIDPLDFASAESSPDPLVRALVDHREVWLFGTRSIEPWINTGASPFPFERVSGSVLERGCIAALSPAKLDNTVYWLGDDKIVYNAIGYQPQRISNFAIEEALRKASDVSDARGFTYSQAGHTFYVLTLPTMGRTFVYDAATTLWHERQSGTSLDPVVWSVNCLVSAWGKIYAGSNSGKVSELDLDTFSELGSPVRRYVRTTPFFSEGMRATMSMAELECELGVGLSTGQGSDPHVMVRWSDDGGRTWSNERQASIGAEGDAHDRAIVRRLGIFRQRELEFAISDPVKVAFYGMRYKAKAMTA